jgi:hypothetical protein
VVSKVNDVTPDTHRHDVLDNLREELETLCTAVERITAIQRKRLANGDWRGAREVKLLRERTAEAKAKLEALMRADRGDFPKARSEAETATVILSDACWYVREQLLRPHFRVA